MGVLRNLLVDYLRERQPTLDYTSLDSLANMLGRLFWADLERHHPGTDSLRLPRAVADAWKQRLRTVTRATRSSNGRTIEIKAERINYRACLTPVRAFYLDLAHWAVEDPARRAQLVAPARSAAKRPTRRRTDAAASPAWMPTPASDCRSWAAASTGAAATLLPCSMPPAEPHQVSRSAPLDRP